MDEMIINSKLMRMTLSKIVSRILRKKAGVETDLKLNSLVVKNNEERATVHIELDAEMSSEQLSDLLKKIGLK